MKKLDFKELKYCCQLMTKFLDDPRVEINYYPIYWEYCLSTSSIAVQIINNCPFCGCKLPKDLRDEWLDILEREYGLDDPYDDEQSGRIPEEFNSDAWWKKRGL